MGLTLIQLDNEHLVDVNRCDSTFTVDSRLVLDAQDGEISYRIVSIRPYQKRYAVDAIDAIAYLDNPDRAIFLAYMDGQIAGQIRVGRFWNRYAYIEDIVVDPPFRKQGVGRALLERAMAWAKAGEYPGIMLETQNNNVAACRLYERMGMKLEGFDTCLYKGITPDTEEIALFWYLVF